MREAATSGGDLLRTAIRSVRYCGPLECSLAPAGQAPYSQGQQSGSPIFSQGSLPSLSFEQFTLTSSSFSGEECLRQGLASFCNHPSNCPRLYRLHAKTDIKLARMLQRVRAKVDSTHTGVASCAECKRPIQTNPESLSNSITAQADWALILQKASHVLKRERRHTKRAW